MKFSKLHSVINESMKFADLPDTAPYGFWISPPGNFWSVEPYSHEEKAHEIINDNQNLLKGFQDYEAYYEELERTTGRPYYVSYQEFLGHKASYCRIVIDRGLKVLYWDMYGGHKISSAQMRGAKDLAMFYNVELRSSR